MQVSEDRVFDLAE